MPHPLITFETKNRIVAELIPHTCSSMAEP